MPWSENDSIDAALLRMGVRGELWVLDRAQASLGKEFAERARRLVEQDAANVIKDLAMHDLPRPETFGHVRDAYATVMRAYAERTPALLILPRGLPDYLEAIRTICDPDPYRSPITAEFLAWHLRSGRHITNREDVGLPGRAMTPIERTMQAALSKAGIRSVPQVRVIGRYILDFVAELDGERVGVECDGRAYHQDVRRDAERDQAIFERTGLRVLRFSGSAIHRDADGCAVRVKRSLLGEGLKEPAEEGAASRLDEEQRLAAGHLDGPCLVLAPAGSGKTHVIAERCRRLVRQEGVEPSRILCLTFTRKARAEMEERMRDLGGVEVRTFHALALTHVRPQLPMAPRFLSAGQKFTLARERVSGREEASSVDLQAALLAVSLRLKRLEMPSSRPESAVDQLFADWVRYCTGRELLPGVQQPQMDFDALIYRFALDLLEDAAVRQAYQQKYDFVLVDEYQDNSLVQEVIARVLAGPGQNFFAVGDDDQSIYRFAGADVGRILTTGDRYPGLRKIVLQHNYRSHGHVVESARALIRHNVTRVDKQMMPRPESVGTSDDGGVFLSPHPSRSAEAHAVTQEVQRLLHAGVPAHEIALLCRTRRSGAKALAALLAAGVPVWARASNDEQGRSESWVLRKTVAVVEALALPTAGDAIRRLWIEESVRPDGVPLRQSTLAEICSHRENTVGELREFSRRLGAQGKQAARSALDRYLEAVESGRAALRRGVPLAEVAQEFRNRHDFCAPRLQLSLRKASKGTTESELAGDWADTLMRLQDERDPKGLGQRIKEETAVEGQVWRMAEEMHVRRAEAAGVAHGEAADTGLEDEIRAFTIHAAKGGEFDSVLLVGVAERTCPHARVLAESEGKHAKEAALEEERRVFYVGVTRAKRRLVVTWSGDASPFVKETWPSTSALANPGLWRRLWRAEHTVADMARRAARANEETAESAYAWIELLADGRREQALKSDQARREALGRRRSIVERVKSYDLQGLASRASRLRGGGGDLSEARSLAAVIDEVDRLVSELPSIERAASTAAAALEPFRQEAALRKQAERHAVSDALLLEQKRGEDVSSRLAKARETDWRTDLSWLPVKQRHVGVGLLASAKVELAEAQKLQETIAASLQRAASVRGALTDASGLNALGAAAGEARGLCKVLAEANEHGLELIRRLEGLQAQFSPLATLAKEEKAAHNALPAGQKVMHTVGRGLSEIIGAFGRRKD